MVEGFRGLDTLPLLHLYFHIMLKWSFISGKAFLSFYNIPSLALLKFLFISVTIVVCFTMVILDNDCSDWYKLSVRPVQPHSVFSQHDHLRLSKLSSNSLFAEFILG